MARISFFTPNKYIANIKNFLLRFNTDINLQGSVAAKYKNRILNQFC